jgi:hypothetical protein
MTKTIGKASTRTVLEPAEKFLRKLKKHLTNSKLCDIINKLSGSYFSLRRKMPNSVVYLVN